VTDDLWLKPLHELKLVVEVGGEETTQAVVFGRAVLRSEAAVESLLVKVDRLLVAVVNAADEILDGLAFAGDQAFEFVESSLVDVLRLQPDEDGEVVRLEFLQPMRLYEVLVERIGEVSRGQMCLRAEEGGVGERIRRPRETRPTSSGYR
jgi:hypothetical protein